MMNTINGDKCQVWVLTLELTDHCDHKTLLPQLQCAPFCLVTGTYWLETHLIAAKKIVWILYIQKMWYVLLLIGPISFCIEFKLSLGHGVIIADKSKSLRRRVLQTHKSWRQLLCKSKNNFAAQQGKEWKQEEYSESRYLIFLLPPPILMVSIRMQQGCINGHHHGTTQSLNQSDIVHRAWIQKQF